MTLRLALPFTGAWRAEMSPATRVPSHGTHAFGLTHSVDFVGIDARGRSAPRTARSLVAVEPPERFVGFGRPILAPVSGTVVETHDGEADAGGRRSPVTLVPFALTQAGRLRQGLDAIAGNRVVIAIDRDSEQQSGAAGAPGGAQGAAARHGAQGAAAPGGPFVALLHLRRGSLRVRVGDRVRTGEPVAECGGSGNSTEPHLHLQVTDSLDWPSASGIAFELGPYRRLADGAVVERGMPRTGERIAAL